MIHVPDLSEWQSGPVDFSAVKAYNGGAVIIRVAYGAYHPDNYFSVRRAQAHAAGMRVLGLYAYLVASQDAATQARAWLQLVGHLLPGEFFALDVEEGSGNQLARVTGVLDMLRAGLGAEPWLYTGPYFALQTGLTPLMNTQTGWLADYIDSEPSDPAHVLWQHTNGTLADISCQPIPGIGVPCDCSIFNGTIDQLAALVSSTPTEEPMLVITAPNKPAAAYGPYGKRVLSSPEWTTVNAVGAPGVIIKEVTAVDYDAVPNVTAIPPVPTVADIAKAVVAALPAGSSSVDVTAVAAAVLAELKAQWAK